MALGMRYLVTLAVTVLAVRTAVAQDFSSRRFRSRVFVGRGEDGYDVQQAPEVLQTLLGVKENLAARDIRSHNFEGRTFRNNDDGRNFVGMNWFAPQPDVAPQECVASNGALDMGTCHTDTACGNSGGVASGTCSSGGVCCIFPTVCGGIVSRNRTWFVNKDFPEYTRDPAECRLTIKRIDTKIRQVRLDFIITELGDAVQGRCQQDFLTVKRANDDTELVPHMCGENNGQHVYVDFGFQDLQLVMKMTDTQRRKWHILVTQVTPGQEAPQGCLQYYSDRSAAIKSLNYNSGSYLFKGNLDYDICFPPLDSFAARDATCERKAEDVDLRQSENDIRTRRGKNKVRGRRRRSADPNEFMFDGRTSLSNIHPRDEYNRKLNGMQWQFSKKDEHETGSLAADLPLVMAFKDLQENRNVRRMRRPTASRAMANSYAMSSDPVYSQINQVMSQLRNPASSGLESLLKSRSQLDTMDEEYGKKDEVGDDEAYYYYYYEEDPEFYNNEDVEQDDHRYVTGALPIDEPHQDLFVLPQGSPVNTKFFSNNQNKFNHEHSSSTFNGEKYFHTGMLEDSTKKTTRKDTVTENQYPTPTWFQRPTSPKVNLLRPDLPVAQIMVYDPMTHVPDEELVYANPYSKEPKPILNDYPNEFTFDDLSTLSSISPKDEYNLKHDGMQWLFSKKDEHETGSLTGPVNVELPHQIKVSSESVTGNKPHLIFKHPSGIVTEMHISPGSSDNSKEKIITVIETGPITQNFTKIKIEDISQLDKVIESVFDIMGENNINLDIPVPDTTQSNYPKTKYTSPFATTPTDFQNPEPTYYTSFRPEDLKMTTNTGINEELLTTLYNTRLTNKPSVSKRPIVSIQRTPRPTATPSGVTRIVTRPKITRLSTRPSPDAIRLTPNPYRATTPSSPTSQFSNVRPGSTLRYALVQPSQRPSQRPLVSEIPRAPVTNMPTIGTAIPTTLYSRIRQGNTNPSQESSTVFETDPDETMEPEAITPETLSTVPSLIVQTDIPNDPFTEMLTSMGVETITPEPLFTISTRSNGKLTTKTYSTVEDAMSGLTKITAQTVTGGNPTSRPGDFRFSTIPLSAIAEDEATQNPFGETTISEDLKKLITNSDNEDVAYFNNNICGDSYLKVNNFKICDQLLRSEPVREEAKDLFSNIERISVRSLGESRNPLRFSLKYDTVCVVNEDNARTTPANRRISTTYTTNSASTTGVPEAQTINLLQYLLGWYR